MLPEGGRLTSGRIEGLGQTWSSASDEALAAIPGEDRIAMVFQEPMTSLDPTMRCGRQLERVLRRHSDVDRKAAMDKVRSLLEEVQMPDVDRAMSAYPHELSGGQKQRILIAMALSNDPDILLADEPTTALDSTLRAELLFLLRALQQRRGLAMVLVTHDMEVVERHADRVAVLYRGEVVEQGPAKACSPDRTIRTPVGSSRAEFPAPDGPPRRRSWTLSGGAAVEGQDEIRAVPDESPVLLEVRGATKTYPGSADPALRTSPSCCAKGSLGIVGGSG